MFAFITLTAVAALAMVAGVIFVMHQAERLGWPDDIELIAGYLWLLAMCVMYLAVAGAILGD